MNIRIYPVALFWLALSGLSACRTPVAHIPAGPIRTLEQARMELAELESAPLSRPSPGSTDAHWQNYRTGLRQARYLISHYEPNTALLVRVSQHLDRIRFERDAVRQPFQPSLVPGHLDEGYFDPIDDSFQPFVRYLPAQVNRGRPLPLLVFLHGYSPSLNIVNWDYLPDSLVTFAEQEGWALAAPFGRGNTDYQGIGEQDVLQVIREMETRYPIDPDRIVLAGISMGGMGTWTIGAHHPDRFAGLIVIAGRGDYYLWQETPRETLPPHKQQLIDAEFGASLLSCLQHTPIYCVHGAQDPVVPVDESRHMVRLLKPLNPQLTYVELPEGDHGIFEEVFERPDLHAWLQARHHSRSTAIPRASGSNTPTWGPVKKAFLEPFVFVCTTDPTNTPGLQTFQARCREWYRYAKANPRTAFEGHLDTNLLARHHVFLLGEPETSPLIRQVLEHSPVRVTATTYQVGPRIIARNGRGLYAVCRNPWNPQKRAVVQCGIPWGTGLPFNHKYDLLPDYIVYGPEPEPDGCNEAICAGFFTPDGHWDARLESVTPKP